ncbi:hypothetical protein [Sphingomonas sp. M1-B02]|uniref:hypothetical protein n=1 Tax=Sphingomonas sp. M1-B02 TaxID=3114300 RepID=UPI00224098E8|nr:hypothetical protein [Sphingomonas sp. S6-11]UZK68026.1 hypothetical protein OKW87_00825 [Sphingomonas sp. S6-11]
MGNSKPAASLSSGLLARKGHARPAMRPQGFVGLTPLAHEDLGWNDMGDEAPYVAPAPVDMPVEAPKPAVLRQREALDEQIAKVEAAAAVTPEPAKVESVKPASAPLAKKSKAAFTLRLDAERHLRLRLASAVTHRSAQMLVTQALDAFLESLAEVEALARQIDPAKDRG